MRNIKSKIINNLDQKLYKKRNDHRPLINLGYDESLLYTTYAVMLENIEKLTILRNMEFHKTAQLKQKT